MWHFLLMFSMLFPSNNFYRGRFDEDAPRNPRTQRVQVIRDACQLGQPECNESGKRTN